jgi:N-acetylglutamate synthase-like GNAT family acetyltransferase
VGAAAHVSVMLRRARTTDVRAIHDLIELYAQDRILLAKERVQLY